MDHTLADPLEQAINAAESRLQEAAEHGLHISTGLSKPILAARDALTSGVSVEIREAFYAAYADVSKAINHHQYHCVLAPDPVVDSINNAEKLLRYAAEMSIEVPTSVASDILAGHTAALSNTMTDKIRGDFYAAFTKLSSLFGGATVQTIEDCHSAKTEKILRVNRWIAVVLTFFIATTSVVTFIANDEAKGIANEIAINNEVAARLRASLTSGTNQRISEKYSTDDVCQLTLHPGESAGRQINNADDVTQLQDFAARIRSLDRLAKRLNQLVFASERVSDPYPAGGDPSSDPKRRLALQISPAISDYTAEVLCKIRSYQDVRSFANSVQSTYSAWYGGISAFGLPIFYALLGAYAFRLRLFGDTIRKRTYHPSFADSARMISAVIAGAIVGLFYPAQGASLSPLAISFLVGYGVEVFFKLLDGAINSLGPTSFVGQRSR